MNLFNKNNNQINEMIQIMHTIYKQFSVLLGTSTGGNFWETLASKTNEVSERDHSILST